MTTEPITYLDNNATTCVDSRVLEAMLPYLRENYGNPSSVHRFGARLAAMLEEARHAVAGLINARDSEIVFTSGGTESKQCGVTGHPSGAGRENDTSLSRRSSITRFWNRRRRWRRTASR